VRGPLPGSVKPPGYYRRLDARVQSVLANMEVILMRDVMHLLKVERKVGCQQPARMCQWKTTVWMMSLITSWPVV
jgi:hypothetical protein